MTERMAYLLPEHLFSAECHEAQGVLHDCQLSTVQQRPLSDSIATIAMADGQRMYMATIMTCCTNLIQAS